MKAVQVLDRAPTLVDLPDPDRDQGVEVRVVSSSICGSDLHLIELGFAEGFVLGHEFCGITPDGTAVAIEPTIGCGSCVRCREGQRAHCVDGFGTLGIGVDGGMAERVVVPPDMLVALPSGLDTDIACLIEPLAVAVHGVNRARITPDDRVLVLGAGPIGLALVAVLADRSVHCDVSARHEHQQVAATRLGGSLERRGDYDVVLDAVGTSESLGEAVGAVVPRGRIGLVGSLWAPATVDMTLCMREAEIIPAITYSGTGADREFSHAARLLADHPGIADALITHRFPLDAPSEAFAAAADRRGGAIKVVFDIDGREAARP